MENRTQYSTIPGSALTARADTVDGFATSNGYADQPLQWSSEYNDTELGLIYCNYRHYNHVDGRWLGRDSMNYRQNKDLYGFIGAHVDNAYDYLGLFSWRQNAPIPKLDDFPDLPTDLYEVEISDNTPCGRAKKEALQSTMVKNYMQEIQKKGCGLPEIVCACCANVAGAWHMPVSEEKHIKEAHIVICNNGNADRRIVPGYLMHELTHFLQVCENRGGKDADMLYINEVEANKMQGKNLKSALDDALWSVRHTKQEYESYIPSEVTEQKAKAWYAN